MSENSATEWTTHTANFWWGCQKVSDGCKNCCADVLANRFTTGLWGSPKTTRRERKKGIWKDLPKWNRRAGKNGVRERVFVMSMGDFFEDHPDVGEWRKEAWHLMHSCVHLDFLFLTKRPENINKMLPSWRTPDNFWFGTSVENQKQADKRIPELLNVRASVHFLSCEPLLGDVDLFDVDGDISVALGETSTPLYPADMIDWVIVGGESGANARPVKKEWATAIRDQCAESDIKFMFKQWGAFNENGERVGKHAAGRLLDGVEHNGVAGDYYE